MIEHLTIPNVPPEHPILDYDALVREGIRKLERMSDGSWTDFNAHDPGITILEAACYALTDLGYRIFHDLPDLLADGGADARAGLYSAATALSSSAVTIADLRRVALDVEGVKDAWVEPVQPPAVRLKFDEGARELSIDSGPVPDGPAPADQVVLKGLYRVIIEKSDLEDIDGAALRRAVARRLHAHRNLCEDFDEIRVLDTQPIAVFAAVEIGETDNAEEVLTDIYERIATQISPAVPFLTLSDLAGRGIATDAAFDGPALTGGFIDQAGLKAARHRKALHVSDLVREVMAVDGVRAVRRLRLAKDGVGQGEPWSLTLDDPNATPQFSLQASRIELFKGQFAVSLDDQARARVAAAFGERLRAARLFRPLPTEQRDVPVPAGVNRDVAAYFPLEGEFPLLYGIGRGALPGSAAPARLAQANQLRAYLAFFDQILANSFAQLAHARELLSFDGDGTQSTFSQPLPAGDGAPLLPAGFDAAGLQALIEPASSEGAAKRRNRFLNHLLARFGEQLSDDPLPVAQAVGGAAPMARLLACKRSFLRQFPRLSAGRGSGHNYLEAGVNATAPLAERLRLKLALPDGPAGRLYIVEHILLRAISADAVQQLPFLAAAESRDPFSLQLSILLPGALKGLAPLVDRVVREETPAHLVPYIHWLNDTDLDAFAAAYEDWLATLRQYALADQFGIDEDIKP